MSFQSQIMAGGLAAETAKAIVGSALKSATSTGTNQATALALGTSVNFITTVPSGTGVKLPTMNDADLCLIFNRGVNALLVYPPVGLSIDSQAVNASVSIPAGTPVWFWGSGNNNYITTVTSASTGVADMLAQLAASTGSGLVGFSQSGTGPATRTLQAKGREVSFSLMDKSGAVADGVTDLTTQWANLIADANAQVAAAVLSGFPISAYKVSIPPGDYQITTGATMANCNLVIEGSGRENTRIQIGAGQYLLTVTSSVYNFTLRGVQTSGGKGVLKHTLTGNNVLGNYVVEDNHFFDYTECAIGSLSADMPYWKIRRNTFYGSSGLASKGIALAADNSSSVIEGNAFQRNKYHIKLGRAGVTAKIVNNEFIRFTNGGGAPALTDIWLVPSTLTTDSGLVISSNKFGNENRNNADFVVLVAEEAAGTDFVTKDHATTVSANYATGVVIRDNDVGGAGIPTNGVIYSYTPNIGGWLVDDVYRGSQFPYIIQFDAGVTVDAERSIESNIIRPARGYLQNEVSARLNYSNAPSIGMLDDPLVNYAGFDSTRTQYPVAFDPGFTDLWTTASSGARLLNQASITRTNITDAIGGADAAEYTFSASGGFAYGYIAAPTPNRQAWLYFEIKKSTVNPISRLMVDVRYDSNVKIPLRRIVYLSTNWQPVIIPWTPRTNSAVQHIEFRVAVATDYSAAVSDRFQVGRIKIYHASMPMHFGARYLEASAVWDPPNVLAAGSTTTTVAVAGAVLGDFADASFSLDLQGMNLTAYVSAADTVTVVLFNGTAGALNLASGTVRARARKKDS